MAINLIADLVTRGILDEPAVLVYFLADVLTDYNLTDSEDQKQFIQVQGAMVIMGVNNCFRGLRNVATLKHPFLP